MKIEIVINLISCSNHNLDQTLFSFLLSRSNHQFSLLIILLQPIVPRQIRFCYSPLSQGRPGPVLWSSLTRPTPEKNRTNPFGHVADGRSRWKNKKKMERSWPRTLVLSRSRGDFLANCHRTAWTSVFKSGTNIFIDMYTVLIWRKNDGETGLPT